MAANYSKIDLMGFVGHDPEPLATTDGTQGARFSIAINRVWTDTSGIQQSETSWFQTTTWGQLAENCLAYLTKGRLVFVTGRPQIRQWEDEHGLKRERLQIRADQVIFLGHSSPKEEDE